MIGDGDEAFVDRRADQIKESGPTVPLDYEGLVREAERRLPREVYDYVHGGAGDESAVRTNREAFDRYRIVPRVLRDVSEFDLSVRLFGREAAAPVGLAPVGGQMAYHPEGEVASARAAAELGVPFSVSTGSSRSLEDVAEAVDEAGDCPLFFQLYWPVEWEVAASLVERAEAAGYDAVMLTLDSQLTKWRRRNLRNDFALADAAPKGTLTADPVVRRLAAERDDDVAAVARSDALAKDRSVTWDDLGFLREHTDLPIVLKGIVHPEDARLALAHDADGVVVSTHGGRQIAGARAALSALPDVVDAVDGEIPVLFDSGVRTGADAFVALALGADAVFLGRPFVFGLAIAGRTGVSEVVANTVAELNSVLGLSGHTAVDDVDRSALVDERERG